MSRSTRTDHEASNSSLHDVPSSRFCDPCPITGFWWSYVKDEDEDEEDLDEPKEDPCSTLPDQDGIHPVLVQAPSNPDEPSIRALQEHLYGLNLSALEDMPPLKGGEFHTMLSEDQMVLHEHI